MMLIVSSMRKARLDWSRGGSWLKSLVDSVPSDNLVIYCKYNQVWLQGIIECLHKGNVSILMW